MRFWAAPRSLVATGGISVDFFSSGYLDISVHRVRLQWLCIHHWIPLARWVSPFGHCRIKACCQLPDTFRRLPRPSSPLTAKASTVCACSLDHITPSRLGRYVVSNVKRLITSNKSSSRCFALASTTRHGHSFQNARYVQFVKERHPASTPGSFRSLCALSTFRVVGLGGLEPPASPLSGVRSNHLSYRPNVSFRQMVEPVGIEPTTPCLQSRCSPS